MRACSEVPQGQREQLNVLCLLKTEETEEDNETAKKGESFLKLPTGLGDGVGGYFPIPRRGAAPACGQNTGQPRRPRGLCPPSPCSSQIRSSAEFEALSRLCPSFSEGGGDAVEGSWGGPGAQSLLVACPWHLSLGRAAWTSSVCPQSQATYPSKAPRFCLFLVCLFGLPPTPP